MSVIAIRRGMSWIYDPEPETVIKSGGILFARGHDEGGPLFLEIATGKPFVYKVYLEIGIAQLERAVLPDTVFSLELSRWMPRLLPDALLSDMAQFLASVRRIPALAEPVAPVT